MDLNQQDQQRQQDAEERNPNFGIDFGQLSQQLDEGTLQVDDPDVEGRGKPTPHQTPEAKAPAQATEKPEPKTDETDTAGDQNDGRVRGVLTPDGKTLIPYQELGNARKLAADRGAALEDMTSKSLEMAETIRQQAAQIESMSKTAPSDVAKAKAAELIEEAQATGDWSGIEIGITEIEGEAAWLGAAVRKIVAPIQANVQTLAQENAQLKQQLGRVNDDVEARQAAAAAAVQEQVDTAIENLPILGYWRDHAGKDGKGETGDTFVFARSIDDRLRADKAWADKSMGDRFAEVQRRVIAAFGEEVVPETLRTLLQKDPKLNPTIAQGRELLANTAASMFSLSDLPGGSPAHASAETAFAAGDLSQGQLEDALVYGNPDRALAVFGRTDIN